MRTVSISTVCSLNKYVYIISEKQGTSFFLHVWMQTTKNKASYPITGLDRHLGLQEADAPKISRQSAHEGRKVVSRIHRRLYHPSPPPNKKRSMAFISVRGRV
jgi:hypothetical protein